MILGAFALSLLLWTTPSDVVTVGVPPRGSVNLMMNPAGKVELDQTGSRTHVKIEIDKLPPIKSQGFGMNTYVVWAVSPEGSFENIGELEVDNGKGRLDATSRFDQLAILITAEPHYLVDLPSAIVAYRNLAPNNANVRRIPIAVQIGTYDYSNLKPAGLAIAGVVAEARAAFQIAAGAEAEKWAASEFRLARVALDTMEEMASRATPLDILAPRANESIRRSFRAFVAAREGAAAGVLESVRNDAAVLKRETQQLQDRVQQLTADQTAAAERARKLQTDLETSTRNEQQLAGDVDDLRRKQTALESAVALKLPAEFFDYAAAELTPQGMEALSRIAAAAPLWTNPVRIGCPAMGVNIAKRFFSDAGVPDGRIVLVAN